MSSSRFTQNPYVRAMLFLIGMVLLSSCAGMPSLVWPEETPDPAVEAAVQSTLEAMGVNNPAKPAATAVVSSDSSMTNVNSFTPVWNGLDPKCKSVEQVLADHGLTADMVIVHPVRKVSWEPCLLVFEFKEQYRGSTVKLDVLGYADTIALVDDDVTQFFSGDPDVTQVASQWGFSARWGRTYQETAEGRWLNPNNSCEWNVREYRFGRYWRLPNIGLPDVPYYTRVGPYMTMPGNTNCNGWVPPALDEIVPQDYLQATAMLGGLAIESQWKHSPDKANWAWKYSGDGTFKWQTVYMPQASYGYVELWVDGGPKKFYATDLAELMLGNLNVEEFSYHSNPNE